MTRSVDARMCSSALRCSSVSPPRSNREISSYRFAGIPSAPHKIQELFLLKFRLLGGDVRTVELDEPIAFDVLLHFSRRQFTAGPFQNLRR